VISLKLETLCGFASRNCIVMKPLALYTQQSRMGKRNKVVKLTNKKIKYIIRAKTNNISTKLIALEMKVSESTVKRVWMYWMKKT